MTPIGLLLLAHLIISYTVNNSRLKSSPSKIVWSYKIK